MEKNCETTRNRMSWYWLVSMLVRSLVGYCEYLVFILGAKMVN